MHPSVQHFYQLFDGYRKAYGLYKLDDEDSGINDSKAKGHGVNIAHPVTVELWHKHLIGELRLGIIPINEDNKVKWGCIDIDEYTGLNYKALYDRVIEKKLPLTLCRTKSGGIHCYIFLEDWTNASLVRRKLGEMAAAIGHGQSEIFPKQDRVMYEKGDLGNWVNMPYFNDHRTLQYGIDPENGQGLAIEDFVRYAYDNKISSAKLRKLVIHSDIEAFTEGPPCLNFLAAEGIPEGTRNDTLFNVAIYCKKVSPDNWKPMVEDYNARYFKPALSAKEVIAVIRSVDTKDYGYTCNRVPLKTYCDKSKCRTCKFGIGRGSAGLPVMGSLTKYNSQPPIWFVEIEDGGRLVLSTEELQQPYGFQKAAMDQLNIMPVVPKRETWNILVSNLMANVMVIEAPPEASPAGVLWDLVEDFCLTRSQDEPDCLLRGLVYTNAKYHFFRLKDFMEFCQRKKFVDFGRNEISHNLKERGAKTTQKNIKSKCVGVIQLKAFDPIDDELETEDFETDNPF